ncbi:MAG: ribosome small subunit-dependent GTPase, partial [Candidatus Thiodiazotropha taylori]|nr:ribosome small subunit-dependent GTPase [Candidatus Thiodiazotropha taylori]MCW4254296.1 ribosome small subunit-dependent GTPase [Candidatus Thiodiazotropha taylori]
MAKRRLTNQQRNRIKAIQEKRRQRLDQRANQALSSAAEQSEQEGVVIIRHGATLGIDDGSGRIYR